jgi:hypothetical protein
MPIARLGWCGWVVFLFLLTAPGSNRADEPATLNYRVGSLANDLPQAVYSADAADSWNVIFHALFARTLQVRLSSDFADAAPFERTIRTGPADFLLSTRTFERVERSDRAIEPFDAFLGHAGFHRPSPLFGEPRFTRFMDALNEALRESRVRSPLARALMQADLWAAYDHVYLAQAQNKVARERKEKLLDLLARMIKKLALTRPEIAALPDNFAAARFGFALFAPEGGWIEVEHHPRRAHERNTDYRRVARVFLKPRGRVTDRRTWLTIMRDGNGSPRGLEAAALVTQLLLIDTEATIVPTSLTYEVQTRSFTYRDNELSTKVDVAEAELSRKRLLLEARDGGLRRMGTRTPALLPRAGNDYGMPFPTDDPPGPGPPVLVPLPFRCDACHGESPGTVFTLQKGINREAPPIRPLDTRKNEHAQSVIERKINREDFKLLIDRWAH